MVVSKWFPKPLTTSCERTKTESEMADHHIDLKLRSRLLNTWIFFSDVIKNFFHVTKQEKLTDNF